MNIAKQKQTDRQKEQTNCYKQGTGRWEEQDRGGRLRDKSYCVQNKQVTKIY